MNTLTDTQGFYQPITRSFHTAKETHWFINEQVAEQRATAYLSEAKEKMHLEESASLEVRAQINQALLIATDFGSSEAPFLIGERILAELTDEQYLFEDVLAFFRIAAERGNKQAAHCMACCYAGLESYPELLRAGEYYFTEIANDERVVLADYYFEQSGSR